MTWPLVVSLILLIGSGALALGYELYALVTRRTATITDIVRGWETGSVQHKAVVSGVGIGAVLGLVILLAHFLGGF